MSYDRNVAKQVIIMDLEEKLTDEELEKIEKAEREAKREKTKYGYKITNEE